MDDSTQSNAGPLSGSATSSRIATEVKDIGTELAGAIRDGATSLFEEQRNRAADEIAAFGEVLRRSARSPDMPTPSAVARYTDEAGQQIGEFADTLRGRSWSDLAADVEDFARQWPLAFMTAAVGIGFIAGRFLVSSAAHPPTETAPRAAGGSSGAARRHHAAAGKREYR